MLANSTDSPLDDIVFLARSHHRVTALDALADHPRTRDELRTLTGASPSTISRMVREFEDRHWIRRNGHRYEATSLGAFVASGMSDLLDRIETERKLRVAWKLLPIEECGITPEMVSDATVTVAEADDPYRPVNRFVSLLREAKRFRFVGSDVALLEPCKDVLRERIVDGMQAEIIDPPTVAQYILSTYREHCAESLVSGNLTVQLHDDLPQYGLSILDDRVGITGYDPDSGTVRLLIETTDPEVREWAKSTFDAYRREARPLTLEQPVR